ncbi:hypothetical protein ACFODZ_11210 [Marinicella sediminis]|uniref:FG-GAP repeat protein n=1 Tax=Marinicella sediminis TaxID=1792834 RepID=A0ABV7J9J6_9GAMM|nr:integrin alpha [Marinicella sediminis]
MNKTLLLCGCVLVSHTLPAAVITDNVKWNLDTAGISGANEPIDRFGETVARGDFNGDGIDDLAIGIPNHDFFGGAILNTGTVLVIYGSANGLSTNDEQYLFQTFDNSGSNLETLNGIEANDFFGHAMASGDFNCDGFTDLAVGTPDESVTISGELLNAVGAINIFYGAQTGFPDNGQGSTFIWQGTGQGALFSDFIEDGDRFGWSMTSGNFDGDADNGHACDDLAVGTPFEDFGNANQIANGGVIDIFFGHPTDGITGENRQRMSQNSAGAEGSTDANDQFGLSLAAGRFRDGSAFDDLAVGIPGEDINGLNNAGGVQVFYGSSGGITTGSDEIWSQAGSIEGAVEALDRFGTSVTTGNFDGDAAEDLAIGVPNEHINVDGINDAGAVNVIYGSAGGLTTTGNQIFHQSSPSQNSLNGLAEAADQFGDSLVAGNINYDDYDDLVVGIPRENSLRGAFNVIHGGPGGLTLSGNTYHTLGASLGDEMTRSLTLGDFGNGAELVVGMPGDDSADAENDTGSVQVMTFALPDLIFADDFD